MVDSEAAWVHSRDEWSDGQSTRGSYTVKLPDGRIQKVTFTADDDGYHPVITYEHANGDDDGGGVEGIGAVHDWIGASRGNWYTAPHALRVPSDLRNTDHSEKVRGLGESIIVQPHYHNPWVSIPRPHYLQDPLRLYGEDLSPYDSYEYDYQSLPPVTPPPTPPSHRNPPYHMYKAPMYLPATTDLMEMDDDYGKTLNQKPEESSEEKDDNNSNDDSLSKVKKIKMKSSIYVGEKPKTYLGHGRKHSHEEHSMESEDEQTYEQKTLNTQRTMKKHKKEKFRYDSSGEVEESNEHMMENLDGYEMEEDLDNGEMKYEKSIEMDREIGKTDSREHGKIHSMAVQQKDMEEYLRKIKRVMARFEKPRTPYHRHLHHALYRHDTTKMVTPRKWTPKKTSKFEFENDSGELQESLRQLTVKMTPPDKSFYNPNKMDVKMTQPDKASYTLIKMDVKMTPPDKPFYNPNTEVKMMPPDKAFYKPNRMNFGMTPLKKPSPKPREKTLHRLPKMSVKMTPPDKPFYIPSHHSPSPPSPSPKPPATPIHKASPIIRKHTLQKHNQKGIINDFILNTSAPMLHAPPPPTPLQRRTIESKLLDHHLHLFGHS